MIRKLPHWSYPILAGVGLALSFPGPPSPLIRWIYSPYWAYVALLPMMFSVCRSSSREAFYQGWLAGGTFNLIALYWVAGTQGGGPAVVGGTFLLAAYLGLFTAVWAWLCQKTFTQWGYVAWIITAPALWTAVEYLLSLGQLGFPWLLLGHGQAGEIELIQFAEFTGVYGVSFWVVLINALLYCVFAHTSRHKVCLIVLAGVFAGPWLYSQLITKDSEHSEESLQVALIQPSQPFEEKWGRNGLTNSLRRLKDLSLQTISKQPDLLVWPEVALPCYLAYSNHCRQNVQTFVDSLDIPLITGASHYNQENRRPYNAAFYLEPEATAISSYSKMHLVPFGERTPYRDTFPILRSIDWTKWTGDLGPAEFSAGSKRTLFSHPSGALGTLICFESIFPNLVRQHAQAGAQALINVTNDSWFGNSAGPYQHALLNAMRAIENRISIARCATSGQSLFIDRFGRRSQMSALYAETALVGEIKLNTTKYQGTFYTQHGDVFAQLCTIAGLVFVVILWFKPRRKI